LTAGRARQSCRRVLAPYLDPATSLGELLFGLLRTLTFTLNAGILVQEEGPLIEGSPQLSA
jgi:hypothetical protein